MLGEEGLVAGDDDLARVDGSADERERLVDAAHEFDDDVHGGIVDEVPPASGQAVGRQVDGAGFGQIAHDGAAHDEFQPEAFGEQGAVLGDVFVNARPNCPQTRESDPDLTHRTVLNRCGGRCRVC